MSSKDFAREGQPRCQACTRKIWWGNGGWNHMNATWHDTKVGSHKIVAHWPGDVRAEVVNVVRPVDC